MAQQDTLIGYLQHAIVTYWDLPAMTDYKGPTFTYRDVARKIAKLHLAFQHAGLRPGDRVALCGRNSSQWAMVMLACLTQGVVAVPILHDFKPDTIHHLVNHSGSKLLFADATTWENIDAQSMPHLVGIVSLTDFSLLMSRSEVLTHAREHLNEYFGKEFPDRFGPQDIHYRAEDPKELALINYTSGSTGFSKGVMLTYGNLWSNLQFTFDKMKFLKPGDQMVSMLPLAHMYGLMEEMLHTFAKGVHNNFLTRTPSPRILLEAFGTIRPKLVITVPLVIEKIVKTRIFPRLRKTSVRIMLHLPLLRDKVLEKIRQAMLDAFGGNLKELIIGGAGVSTDVEAFLRRIHFPYTVGYGMTECGPLVAYAPWSIQRPGSCGRLVDRMEMKVDSPDPAKIPGNLYVRGANVMKGYYNNPEATKSVFTSDGWMDTGDIVNVDPDGYIYIRGRDKNMILGPSGQNIYPEEIEARLNNMPYVAESLVIDDKDHNLIALVVPDHEKATKDGISDEQLDKMMTDNVAQLNKTLPVYSQIRKTRIFREEFEKTPKRSIKRYLYMNN